MAVITIRSLAATLAQAQAGAEALAKVAKNRQDSRFYEVAWSLAEIVAPLGSDPYAYLLNTVTREAYPEFHLTEAELQPLEATATGVAEIRKRFQDGVKLLRQLGCDMASALDGVRPIQKDREWIRRALATLNPPLDIPKTNDLPGFLHIASYLHFHLGEPFDFIRNVWEHDRFDEL